MHHYDNCVRQLRSAGQFNMSTTRDDQSVFNRNRKFRSKRRNKRKFAGNRFVTATRDPVEREEAIVKQNIAMTVDEGQDETVGNIASLPYFVLAQ